MKVDISPNFPPSSSCTAAAELGEGLSGWGSSVWSLSNRVIMDWVSFCNSVRRDRDGDRNLGRRRSPSMHVQGAEVNASTADPALCRRGCENTPERPLHLLIVGIVGRSP